MFDLARKVDYVHKGSCTSDGTTSTIVDSALTVTFPDASIVPGILFMPSRTVVTVQPDESRQVTAWTTPTMTITPVLSAISKSGNPYYVCGPRFQHSQLVTAINQALLAFGKIPLTATFAAVDDQEEYTTTDNANLAKEIIMVEVAHDSAAPYDWQIHQGWQQIHPTAVSGNRTLKFDQDQAPSNTYNIRITYLDYHSEVTTDAGVIHHLVPREWLSWAAAVEAWRTRAQITMGDEPISAVMFEDANKHYLMENQKLNTINRQATSRLSSL